MTVKKTRQHLNKWTRRPSADFRYANMYLDAKTYEEWKELCDNLGVRYAQRVTQLMKGDIPKLKSGKLL
jgi:hypothetical protein